MIFRTIGSVNVRVDDLDPMDALKVEFVRQDIASIEFSERVPRRVFLICFGVLAALELAKMVSEGFVPTPPYRFLLAANVLVSWLGWFITSLFANMNVEGRAKSLSRHHHESKRCQQLIDEYSRSNDRFERVMADIRRKQQAQAAAK